MRRVGHQLHDLLERGETHLVQAERQNDRDGKTRQHPVQPQRDRVPDQPPEQVGVKKALEILKTSPLAVPDTAPDAVISEGDLGTQHGIVGKHQSQGDRNQQEQVQLPAFFDPPP